MNAIVLKTPELFDTNDNFGDNVNIMSHFINVLNIINTSNTEDELREKVIKMEIEFDAYFLCGFASNHMWVCQIIGQSQKGDNLIIARFLKETLKNPLKDLVE